MERFVEMILEIITTHVRCLFYIFLGLLSEVIVQRTVDNVLLLLVKPCHVHIHLVQLAGKLLSVSHFLSLLLPLTLLGHLLVCGKIKIPVRCRISFFVLLQLSIAFYSTFSLFV